MKKLFLTMAAFLLAFVLPGSAVLAGEAVAPGQPINDSQAAPVIAAQQTEGTQQAPTDTTAPTQQTPSTQTQENSQTVFETPDGVLSMKMPAGTTTWSIVQDPSVLLAISNGKDRITVEHTANGDTVPEPKIAEEQPEEIFQIFYSTGNEIFVITGYAADAQSMTAVRDAVCSFKVLKYDTMVKKEVPKGPQVREGSETRYSIQGIGVNVRADANTSSEVIGGIRYGEAISITGYVIENGVENGWLQINYNGKTGYVHSSNFSKTQPPARTGNSLDLYAPEGGGVIVTVYELEDGRYMDNSGNYYTKDSDTEFFDDKDNKWVLPEYFEDNPTGQNFTDFYMDMIDVDTEETVTVRGMTDGRYINEETGVIYEPEGGGGPHMYGDDGSTLMVPEEYYNYYEESDEDWSEE